MAMTRWKAAQFYTERDSWKTFSSTEELLHSNRAYLHLYYSGTYSVTNFSQNSQQKGSLYLSPDHMHLRINMWISRLNKYLRLRISTFEQRDTEQNAFWENPVISGVHYHIYDQFWGTFFVQEALDIKHGHPRLICILSWKPTCKLDKYTNPIHVCFTHIYENEPISSHKAHNSNIINLILKFCQPKSPLIKRRFLYEIPVLGSKNKK